jgi:putative NADH-flavin reductase
MVTAYIRRAGTLVLQHPNLKIIVGNLNESIKIREAITGSNVVISALGGRSLSRHSTEIIA